MLLSDLVVIIHILSYLYKVTTPRQSLYYISQLRSTPLTTQHYYNASVGILSISDVALQWFKCYISNKQQCITEIARILPPQTLSFWQPGKICPRILQFCFQTTQINQAFTCHISKMSSKISSAIEVISRASRYLPVVQRNMLYRGLMLWFFPTLTIAP